jgi:type 1 glutamine amidotransferase
MAKNFHLALFFALVVSLSSAESADRILIFTKTAGVRENNIADTRKALKGFYEGKGLAADTSENGAFFSDTGLTRYKAVVFLKNTGDFLTNTQQTAFEKWFSAGGGVQFIHSALDAEMSWPFYGKLIGGAWFQSLPGDSNTTHTVVVEDTLDASTRHIPNKRWQRKDEIYGFKANPRAATNPTMHILLTVDESTYKNGKAGTDHPMSWYCTYQGGRAWTTAMGHVTPAYSDSTFLGHLWGGMEYILNRPAVVSLVIKPGKTQLLKIKSASLRKFSANRLRFNKDASGRETRTLP